MNDAVKLVRMEHTEAHRARTVVVDWTLGTLCNHRCSYCPPALHDGSRAWPELAVARAFAERVVRHCANLNRTVVFHLSGGEPTLYPGLLPLLATCRSLGARLELISNGSRSLGWWSKALPQLDAVILTHHWEFVHFGRFLSLVELASSMIETHVNVTMLPDRFNECLARAAAVARSHPNVTVTLKPLLIDFGERMYPYSAEQQQILQTPAPGARSISRAHRARGPMRCTDAAGRTQIRSAVELLARGETHWAGWACCAGIEMLAVDARGFVHRGVCKEGGALGHIDDVAITLPTEPTVCTRTSCHCLADIMTTRYALNASG